MGQNKVYASNKSLNFLCLYNTCLICLLQKLKLHKSVTFIYSQVSHNTSMGRDAKESTL